MGEHAILGASGSHRWMPCPASIRLAKNRKPKPSSIYAEEGTAAHMLGEDSLTEEERPATQLGTTITTGEGNTFEVTQDMVDAVTVYYDHCYSLMQQATHFGIETRVTLDKLTTKHSIPTKAFGTVDFWAVVRSRLHAVDYKHGQGIPVNVHGNTQLMYYALALLMTLTPKQLKGITEIVLTVVQPRAEHSEGGVRHAVINVLDLLIWGDTVLAPAMADTFDPFSKAVPGEWCRFCPVPPYCEALDALASKTAKMDEFSVVPPDPHTLTDDQLSDVLDRAEVINVFVSACRGEMSARIEANGPAGNWKLVDKRAVRKWKDGVDAESIQTSTGLEMGQILEPRKPRSVAQIEKTLKREGGDVSDLDDLVTKQSSGTTLVPNRDPRDAVLSRGNEFDALPSPEDT